MEIAGYKFEKLDEFEIRITAPNGDAWIIRSLDKSHGFDAFIWDMVEAIISTEDQLR